MTGKEWREKCREVSLNVLGEDEMMFFPDRRDHEVYDDGTLHIARCGLRACFGVDQDAPLKTQNVRMKQVLCALGIVPSEREIVFFSAADIEEDEEEEADDSNT